MNKFTTNSIVTFFITSLFLSVLIQSVMFVNYVVNQKEYTEQFCENKTVPDSNCHGSCHLSKELKLTKEVLPNQLEENSSVVVSIFTFQQVKEITPNFILLTPNEHSFFLKSFFNDSCLNSIFKPPCFS